MTDDRIEPLIKDAFYAHHGSVLLAVDDTELARPEDTTGIRYQRNEKTELLSLPGSGDWSQRMIQSRRALITELKNSRALVVEKTTWIDNLGQALLYEAEKRDWCSEYDEFAEEWDLPRLNKNWEVTMTVTVLASDEETATIRVREGVSIGMYDEGVVDGPEFEASEA